MCCRPKTVSYSEKPKTATADIVVLIYILIIIIYIYKVYIIFVIYANGFRRARFYGRQKYIRYFYEIIVFFVIYKLIEYIYKKKKMNTRDIRENETFENFLA